MHMTRTRLGASFRKHCFERQNNTLVGHQCTTEEEEPVEAQAILIASMK